MKKIRIQNTYFDWYYDALSNGSLSFVCNFYFKKMNAKNYRAFYRTVKFSVYTKH